LRGTVVVGVRAQVLSGGSRAWPLIAQQSEGSGVETEMGKTAGSETSVGLGKLGRTQVAKVGRVAAAAAEHLQ